jgi:murein DD-endopeptidase MepM/ murein hydrolase activator NlpD
MRKPVWSLLLVTTKSLSRVRQAYITGIMVTALSIAFIAGLLGMVRLVWFTTSYGFARYGGYQARQENQGLLQKFKFLNKFISKESEKLEDLVSFEDKVRMQYGLDRISNDVRLAGVGGTPINEEMLEAMLFDPVLVHAEAVKESIMTLLRKAELQDSTLTQVADEILGIQKKWEQRPSIWPAAGRMTSPFGNRFHPIIGYTIFHDGIDIANSIMTPIHATADGVVKFVGVKGDYGKMIIVDHPGAGCETAYAQLCKAVVATGAKVKRGELIGHMGNTGRSTGPHLHYEVRVTGIHRNPLAYILPTDVVVD